MEKIRNWAFAINDVIRTYRKLPSSASKHGGMIGESREIFIREILNKFLPPYVGVRTGQIIDVKGNESKQIDVIITRQEFPVLSSLASSDIILIESVIGAIEIKSKLTGGKKGKLWEALDNIRSVKRLGLHYDRPSAQKYIEDLGVDPKNSRLVDYHITSELLPSGYIFSYLGYKRNLDALKTAFFKWFVEKEASYHDLPDVIVTEGCVMIKNNGRLIKKETFRSEEDTDCLYAARKDDEALTWMLWHLLATILENIGIITQGNTGIKLFTGAHYLTDEFLHGEWTLWGKYSIDKGGFINMEIPEVG